MGRRTNYGFETRQRELKKQKKKEAKAERKRLKKDEEEGLPVEGAVAEGLDEAVEAADVEEVEAEERVVE